jgi:fatty acid desaturase
MATCEETRDYQEAATMTDHERIVAITATIKDADKNLRRRFPILNHQDAMGTGFFLLTTGSVVACSLLYICGVIPWYVCLFLNTICLSVIREIEHDLIHNPYFRTKPFVQNLMMLAVWPFLGNLPHPWFRRRMHLNHHKTSRHEEDFEERLIGNGMKFGPLKLLAMLEPGLASLFRQKEFRRIPFYKASEFYKALFPVATFYLVALYGWLIGHVALGIATRTGASLPTAFSGAVSVLDVIAVVFILPNMLRQVCVQIISSNMHYYGDIDNRLQETQVLNAWYLFPLNLFCCNFGSTHSIHHFVVNQTFYMRQFCAPAAHAAFKKFGVRYNDAGTILRANRYEK